MNFKQDSEVGCFGRVRIPSLSNFNRQIYEWNASIWYCVKWRLSCSANSLSVFITSSNRVLEEYYNMWIFCQMKFIFTTALYNYQVWCMCEIIKRLTLQNSSWKSKISCFNNLILYQFKIIKFDNLEITVIYKGLKRILSQFPQFNFPFNLKFN